MGECPEGMAMMATTTYYNDHAKIEGGIPAGLIDELKKLADYYGYQYETDNRSACCCGEWVCECNRLMPWHRHHTHTFKRSSDEKVEVTLDRSVAQEDGEGQCMVAEFWLNEPDHAYEFGGVFARYGIKMVPK